MDKSDLYRFALLNHWRKEREKYPRPNPYEDGSEFEDEFDLDDIELDEIDFDEEYMMELRAEVPSSDDDGVENDDEVGDDDDEGVEVVNEVKDEFNDDEGDGVEELNSDEECMMELRAEVPSSDDDEVDVGDDVGYEVEDEDNYDDKGDGIEELNSEELFLFSDVKIAKLYKMDLVHDKDSIEYGIEDDRLRSRDGPLRDEIDFWQRSDIELTITEQSEENEKGCFNFFSRIFRRLFRRK
ncbi:uncharacterized protein [Parasteatoda tepidariorum]|uniref:uncharacterized protein n=1 Tax=Parasteatoda tepidariorum TaxID=114398 RepID=UPI0039BD7C92